MFKKLLNKNKQDNTQESNSEMQNKEYADSVMKSNGISGFGYKKAVVAVVIVALLMFGAGIKYARYLEGKPLTDVAEAGNIVQTDSFENPVASTDFVVKIDGCADKTGYFSLSNGTSLRELLAYVNVTAEGDISDFDFSRKPQQGDSYYIKSKNNPVDVREWLVSSTENVEENTSENQDQSDDNSDKETSNNTKININEADLEELKCLEGIGDTKGQAIIDYREKHGGFNRIEDILAVDGIGEKTYEKFKDQITV